MVESRIETANSRFVTKQTDNSGKGKFVKKNHSKNSYWKATHPKLNPGPSVKNGDTPTPWRDSQRSCETNLKYKNIELIRSEASK